MRIELCLTVSLDRVPQLFGYNTFQRIGCYKSTSVRISTGPILIIHGSVQMPIENTFDKKRYDLRNSEALFQIKTLEQQTDATEESTLTF